MIRLVTAVFVFATVVIAHGAAPTRAWRFSRTAASDAEATVGTQVLLSSAEIAGDRLTLRVGFQGFLGRFGPMIAPTIFENDATLKLGTKGRTLPCIALEKPWENGKAAMMSTGEMLGATLAFYAPRGIEDQPLFLQVKGYGLIAFRFADGSSITPPDISRTPERWDLDESVDGNMPGFERVRLTLGAMRVWDGKVTFGLTFTNSARVPFRMRGAPPGDSAILVSGEREFFRKPQVVGSIEKSIAPADGWRPEEPVAGTVTFPLPHRHGLSRLWFAFPGFPDVPLIFDESLQRWRVEKENMQLRGVPVVQQWTRAEQQLFDSVTEFCRTISQKLEARKFAEAFAAFESPAECALLRGIDKVPFAAVDLRPARAQQLAMRGDELSVRMEFRFRFRDQPDSDWFRLYGIARIKRKEDQWLMRGLTLDLAPPWAQGYTAFGESRHFLIFYRPEGAQTEQAMAVLEQLEESWTTISSSGLKLASRYAAFLCLAPEDHKLLTGDRTMNTALASVGGMAIDEQDVFHTYNTAIYVNPFLFAGSSARQRQQMMQTALDHELVHAALAPVTRAWMPGWLVEGIAVHLSGERRDDPRVLADAFANGLTLRSLTEAGALRDPNGDAMRVDQQYALSAAAAGVISRRWGVPKLLQLYQAYSLEYPDAWRGPYGVDYSDEMSAKKKQARLDLTRRLLKRVLGTTIEDIEAGVRQRFHR